VPLPLLPVVSACGADWRPPLLVVDEAALGLVVAAGVAAVVSVAVVVVAAVAPPVEAFPA
jgi:hypothetical protein